MLKRGYEDRLVIDETTYDHQGDYVCEAINAIGGQRKIVQSDPIHIEVRGRPKAIHACGGRRSSSGINRQSWLVLLAGFRCSLHRLLEQVKMIYGNIT